MEHDISNMILENVQNHKYPSVLSNVLRKKGRETPADLVLVLNVSSAESLVQTTMVKKPQNLKL
jgi:hypothetical protein